MISSSSSSRLISSSSNTRLISSSSSSHHAVFDPHLRLAALSSISMQHATTAVEDQHRAQLDRAVDFVKSNVIAARSKSVYSYGIARFLKWVYQYKYEALSPAFLRYVRAESTQPSGSVAALSTRKVLAYLDEHSTEPLLLFSSFGVQDFKRFIVDVRKRDGKPPGRHFTCFPAEFEAQLKLFYKGLKRTTAVQDQVSGVKLSEGKDPFDFSFYRELSRAMLKMPQKEYSFARVFLLLSWNLMCRAGNVVSIHQQHLSWLEDSLVIHFGHMKNDQLGERSRDGRHVYANPTMPDICPILSLAVYCAVFGFDSSGALFPGKSQYDRYAKELKTVIDTTDTQNCISAANIASSDFGSHSARKGATTYAAGCSNGGPSAAAICLRAGWSLPGVQDAYLRYNAAGDMVVGRFVAGLPFETAQFATLPPFFPDETDPLVRAGVADCFPACPDNMQKVSLNALKEIVVCRQPTSKDRIRPTGVPIHIGILTVVGAQTEKIEQLKMRLDEAETSVKSVAPLVARSIKDAFDEHNARNGVVPIDQIKSIVVSALQERAASAPISAQPSTCPAPVHTPNPPPTSPPPTRQTSIFVSGRRMCRVPEDFRFPGGTVQHAWEHWCCGNPAKNYVPFRVLVASDMASTNKRKRLSDFRLLMQVIENKVREKNAWVASPTIAQSSEMFALVEADLPIPALTEKGRQRRKTQLQWTTAVNVIREEGYKHRS